MRLFRDNSETAQSNALGGGHGMASQIKPMRQPTQAADKVAPLTTTWRAPRCGQTALIDTQLYVLFLYNRRDAQLSY
jgi:hypothetical protein